MMKRSLILVAAALGLAACGFQPVYAPQTTSTGARQAGLIGPVEVAPIDGRTGFFLKSELERLVAVDRSGSGPERVLEVGISETISALGLQTDAFATRSDLSLRASWRLLDAKGAVAASGIVDSVVSYDIPLDPFASVAAQNDARERAAGVAAERIRADILLKLSAAQAKP
jgi:LPS-assembly lipoprotein